MVNDIIQILTHVGTTPLLIGAGSIGGVCCSLAVLLRLGRKSKTAPQREVLVALDPSGSMMSSALSPPTKKVDTSGSMATPLTKKDAPKDVVTARFVQPLIPAQVTQSDGSTYGMAIPRQSSPPAAKAVETVAAPSFESKSNWTSPSGKVTQETGIEDGQNVLVITARGLTVKQLDDEKAGLNKRLQKVPGLTFKRYKNLGQDKSTGQSQKMYVLTMGDSVDPEAIRAITEDQAYA